MVWYSHLFKNFPQFVAIHIVKGFSIVNEADVFLEFPCFLYDPAGTPGSSQLLEKFSFQSQRKQCQNMFKLLYSCAYFTC